MTRACHVITAVVLLGVAVALRAGYGVLAGPPSPDAVCAAAAAATGATAVAPLGYRWRAGMGAAIGLVIMLMGLLSRGPLEALGDTSGFLAWAGWRMIAAILLPAALLFRSHYRAYGPGRLFLALAYAVTLPFLAHEAVDIVCGAHPTEQLGGAITLLVLLSGLSAIWAPPAVSVVAWVAVIYMAAAVLDVSLLRFAAPPAAGNGAFTNELTALVLIVCAMVASVGVFQTLAAMYARDARRVNVHQLVEPQVPTMRPSSSD